MAEAIDVDDNDSDIKAEGCREDGGGEDEGSWDAWLDMMDAAAPGDDTDACIEKEATGVASMRRTCWDKGDKDDDESWIQGMMEMGSSSSIFAEEGEGVWYRASRIFVRKKMQRARSRARQCRLRCLQWRHQNLSKFDCPRDVQKPAETG